jgi:hypothetical protein
VVRCGLVGAADSWCLVRVMGVYHGEASRQKKRIINLNNESLGNLNFNGLSSMASEYTIW